MDDSSGWAILFAAVLIFGLGGWAGHTGSDNGWRNSLVDNPEGVAAIRSLVLAERAAEELD